jgi:hypothetical protein
MQASRMYELTVADIRVGRDAVVGITDLARLATGPAGLALDDGISHAVPDLELYVLQQNSLGDAALLGDPERQP